MKKQNFVTGAVILMIANAISKILGAVFKIPLTYILNEEGMAIYNVAFQVYIMFLSFVISGIPLAVSKTVAEAVSQKRHDRVCRIVNVSTIILCVVGIAGSLILYFGAEFFALAMKEEKAVAAIRLISPSVFFVALGTGYKSFFQGISDMVPPAVSQVIEAFIKLAAGFGLAVCFIDSGIDKTAAGAISGVTVGEVFATGMLIVMYLFSKRGVTVRRDLKENREIAGAIMTIALPVLAAAVISNAVSFVDTSVVRMRLLDAGLSSDKARFLYGAYTGYAMTVFNLPTGILATVGVSILPVVAGAIALKNNRKAANTAMLGIKLIICMALPCVLIIYKMSDEILDILFHNTSSALMLKMLSPCILFLCVSQICSSVMQAAGRIILPVIFTLVGSAIKLAAGWWLVGMSEYNIYGAAISMNIGFFVTMILNLAAARKILGLKYRYAEIIIKPAASGVLMYVMMNVLRQPAIYFIGSKIVGTVVTAAAAFLIYILSLALTGAISVKDIRQYRTING